MSELGLKVWSSSNLHDFCVYVEESYPCKSYSRRRKASSASSNDSGDLPPSTCPLSELLSSFPPPERTTRTNNSKAHYSQMVKENAILQSLTATLTSRLNESKSRIKSLERALTSVSEEIKSGVKEREGWRERGSKLQKERDELKEELARREKELKETRETLTRCTRKFTTSQRESKAAHNLAVESLTKERDSALSSVAQLEAKVIEFESFLKSNNGNVARDMEEKLCETRLQLAVVMEERDIVWLFIRTETSKNSKSLCLENRLLNKKLVLLF